MRTPLFSTNQRFPSGPDVIPSGALLLLGTVYSAIAPTVVICPILLPALSVNHSLPSAPDAMPHGMLLLVGTGYSVMTPQISALNEAVTSAVCTEPPLPESGVMVAVSCTVLFALGIDGRVRVNVFGDAGTGVATAKCVVSAELSPGVPPESRIVLPSASRP